MNLLQFCLAAASGSLTKVQVQSYMAQKSLDDSDIKTGKAALHYAAEHGHHGIITLLINCGATIDKKTHMGDTPLHFAARNKQYKAIETLVSRDANTILENNAGETVLMEHCKHNHKVADNKRHNNAALLIKHDMIKRHIEEDVSKEKLIPAINTHGVLKFFPTMQEAKAYVDQFNPLVRELVALNPEGSSHSLLNYSSTSRLGDWNQPINPKTLKKIAVISFFKSRIPFSMFPENSMEVKVLSQMHAKAEQAEKTGSKKWVEDVIEMAAGLQTSDEKYDPFFKTAVQKMIKDLQDKVEKVNAVELKELSINS